MSGGAIGKGYVQVYTGNGKGKTTASLGLAVRAAGHGLTTVIIQFMKGWIDYGELAGVRMLAPYVEIHQAGRDTFVNRKNPDPEDFRLAREGWKLAREIISGRKADIVVLDEVNCAMDFGLLPVGEVLEAIKGKPDGMEGIAPCERVPGSERREVERTTDLERRGLRRPEVRRIA